MKRYIAPIVVTVLIVLYAIGVSLVLFVTMAENPLPIWVDAIILIGPIGAAIAIVAVLIMRIKELKGGEEDAAAKY